FHTFRVRPNHCWHPPLLCIHNNGTADGTLFMLKSGCFLLLLLFSCSALADVELVKVDKSKRRMYLIDDGQVIREFRIALGKSPKGHKQQEGDQRTPEGR